MGRRIHLANLSSGAETGHRRLSHPLTATVICPTVASPAIPRPSLSFLRATITFCRQRRRTEACI